MCSKNEVHADRGEERKKKLSGCICIDSSQVIVIVFFSPWGVSACMSFTSEVCVAC